MKKYILILWCIIVNTAFIPIFSQDKENTKPLELPAFIIEGVEQLNVKSGMKQIASRPTPLDIKELDSLNTYDKQLPILLEADKLPEHYTTKNYSKGFIKGSYGVFNTPTIDAGYQFNIFNFDTYAKIGFNSSQGDEKYSNYNKFYININSDYIADDKFFIFGGSRTRTNIVFNTKSYNLYGFDKRDNYFIDKTTDYFDRNYTQFKFNVESEGAYKSTIFNVGANLNLSKITNDKLIQQYTVGDAFSHHYLQGHANIKNYWKNFLINGSIFIDFESFAENTINFYQFEGAASYFNKNISATAKIGFQIANNSENIDRAGLLLAGNAEYRINNSFTLKADLNSGLEKTEFENIAMLNPYMSKRTSIDYTYNILKLRGALWFHPTTKISLTGGTELCIADRLMNFENDSLAEFKLTYYNGTIFKVFGEGFFSFSKNDQIISKISINLNSLSNNKNFTYTPALQLNGTYSKKWIEALTTNLSLQYIGARYYATNLSEQLNSYITLNLSTDYTINKFTINLSLNNLTNSTVYIWNKYRERGIFASIGLMWQF